MIRIPTSVVLTSAPAVGAGAVYQKLNRSRQAMVHLRRKHSFPLSSGGKIDTRDLATWLVARGCTIQWI